MSTYRWRRDIDGGSIINSHSGGGSFGISGSVNMVIGCCTGLGTVFGATLSWAEKNKYQHVTNCLIVLLANKLGLKLETNTVKTIAAIMNIRDYNIAK